MGVLDFGACARLPGGIPRPLGVMTRLAIEGRSADLLDLLRNEHFIRPGTSLEASHVLDYLAPFTDPLRAERFHFTRRWLQQQAGRVGDTRGQDFRTGRSLNLPPQYLLIHRVTAGATGILCQLDAEVRAAGDRRALAAGLRDAGSLTVRSGAASSPVLEGQLGLDVPGVRTSADRAQPSHRAAVALGHPGERVDGENALVPLPGAPRTGHGHLFSHGQKLRHAFVDGRIDGVDMMIIANQVYGARLQQEHVVPVPT